MCDVLNLTPSIKWHPDGNLQLLQLGESDQDRGDSLNDKSLILLKDYSCFLAINRLVSGMLINNMEVDLCDGWCMKREDFEKSFVKPACRVVIFVGVERCFSLVAKVQDDLKPR